MRSAVITEERYSERIFALADSLDCVSALRPERFMKIMYENRGDAAAFSDFPLPADGLERRNPLIVALGDSVTAGHFEFVADPDTEFGKAHPGPLSRADLQEYQAFFSRSGRPPKRLTEIVDVRAAYPDRFREKLIDRYGFTSVSVVNSGIAGDTVLGMERRLTRDVIRYQPDLILINASLNWYENCGSTADYEKAYVNMVTRCRAETDADIILMTPNAVRSSFMANPASTLESRVEVIRETAARLDVCLADAYRVWEAYAEEGNPPEALLTGGGVHPATAGHELYARVLMKLFA